MLAPLVLPPLVLELFSGHDPGSEFDVDGLLDADGEARQPHDRQADHEQHRAWRGIREPALDADEFANPAARAGHTVEEEQDATNDAGQPEHQAGERIDELQHRQATPEVTLPGIRRQLQRGHNELEPVQSQWLTLSHSSRDPA